MVKNHPFCKILIPLKLVYTLLFISVGPKFRFLLSFCPRFSVFCLFCCRQFSLLYSGVQFLDFFSMFIPLVVVIWVSYRSGACILSILRRGVFCIPVGKPCSVPCLNRCRFFSSVLDMSIMTEGIEAYFTS